MRGHREKEEGGHGMRGNRTPVLTVQEVGVRLSIIHPGSGICNVLQPLWAAGPLSGVLIACVVSVRVCVWKGV